MDDKSPPSASNAGNVSSMNNSVDLFTKLNILSNFIVTSGEENPAIGRYDERGADNKV